MTLVICFGGMIMLVVSEGEVEALWGIWPVSRMTRQISGDKSIYKVYMNLMKQNGSIAA
jgi:hypothetical protein